MILFCFEFINLQKYTLTMETKEVRIVAPKFLDIQNIKGVPCMYIRYNEDTKKHEWLCLETPNNPMTWDEGKEWCNSKGGDYVTLSILKFISKRVEIPKERYAAGEADQVVLFMEGRETKAIRKR